MSVSVWLPTYSGMIKLKQVFVIDIATVKSIWEKENISAWESEGFSGADGFKEV